MPSSFLLHLATLNSHPEFMLPTTPPQIKTVWAALGHLLTKCLLNTYCIHREKQNTISASRSSLSRGGDNQADRHIAGDTMEVPKGRYRIQLQGRSGKVLWRRRAIVWLCIQKAFVIILYWLLGFPCGSAGKESACNVGDLGSIPGLGRSPGKGKGYPLQYSGLENSMDWTVDY